MELNPFDIGVFLVVDAIGVKNATLFLEVLDFFLTDLLRLFNELIWCNLN